MNFKLSKRNSVKTEFWISDIWKTDACKGKFLKDYSTNHVKPFYRKERY